MAERWKIWFVCDSCDAVLELHDPDYTQRHEQQCPAARKAYRGLGPNWYRHDWGQQVLVPHECDYPDESPVQSRG